MHWYAAVEDTIPQFSHLSDAHHKYPNKFILGTEACEGYLPYSQGVYPGDWPRAQTYAHDIIGDLNNYASGWTDWNLLLDMKVRAVRERRVAQGGRKRRKGEIAAWVVLKRI